MLRVGSGLCRVFFWRADVYELHMTLDKLCTSIL